MSIEKEKTFTLERLLSLLKQKSGISVRAHAGKKGLQNKIKTVILNRPGITLAGYFDDFAFNRIQLFGRGENNYLTSLNKDKRRELLTKFCSYKIPCCFFSYDNLPDKIFIDLAERNNISLISVNLSTAELLGLLQEILDKEFSKKQQFHGVMIEVFGAGVLVLGKSGVGKSECALELITKGHTLIADDVVQVNRIGSSTLIARGADLIKYHIEIRGIGIVDVQNLFGVSSTKDEKEVELVIMLEEWKKDKKYERIGLDEKFHKILGVKVPLLIIPVKHGRNISVIIETAVRNKRLKEIGINSPLILNNRIKNLLRIKNE